MDGTYEITDLNVTGAGKILKMKVNGKGVDVVTDITKNDDDEITAISINGTSQEIAGGGSSDIEENKEATIDVSAYTEPVEIVPTEGKDGMAKCTVTLSNIPAAGGTAYAWATGSGYMYTNFATAPANDDWGSTKLLMRDNSGYTYVGPASGTPYTYEKVSDTSFSLTNNGETITLTRDDTKDFTLW